MTEEKLTCIVLKHHLVKLIIISQDLNNRYKPYNTSQVFNWLVHVNQPTMLTWQESNH